MNSSELFIIGILILAIVYLLICGGCAGTGFDKECTVMPNSVTIGWGQETYHSDPMAWQGWNISATWEFK